jgi:peptidoglycan hydrolase CwlO-like protein
VIVATERAFSDKMGCTALFCATQSVTGRRYRTDMLTLDSLKTEVDGLRETVRMADLDSVETRQLLTAQTSTLNALRSDQIGLRGLMDQQARTLAEQGTGIGHLVIAINQTQQEVHALRTDVHGLRYDVTSLQLHVYDLKGDVKDLKSDVKDLKSDVGVLKSDVKDLKSDVGVLKGDVKDLKGDVKDLKSDVGVLKSDVKRMDQNIGAIMRHLGVEPGEA